MINFPRYSPSAKLGDIGVNMVSRIVSDTFGWLFKRNHQEHDFGIDGQIELVTDQGAVTGQLMAVQIKCGQSFLNEKNQWGYVYRGNRKHFNYLVNYPIPVLIILCDPVSYECYWVQFKPELTEPTGSSWKMTVPFENKLQFSKDDLISLLAPVRDGFEELEEYWELNKLIAEAPVILYALDKIDVETQETKKPREFFNRLRSTRELASRCQSKVEITISDYDSDPRELYEIEEVRSYISALDKALPEILFFARKKEPTFTLKLFALCQSNVEVVRRGKVGTAPMHVKTDPKMIMDFVDRHCPALNELTAWLNMSLQQEKDLFYDAVDSVGIGTMVERE